MTVTLSEKKIPTFCSKICLGEADILDVRGGCLSNFGINFKLVKLECETPGQQSKRSPDSS